MSAPRLSSEVEQKIARFHKSLFKTRSSLRNFWINQNARARNFALINSTIFDKTRHDNRLYLVSAASVTPEQLEHDGYILPGVGCLGGALYAVQVFPEESGNYRLHNFGSSVMAFKGYQDLTPYIVDIRGAAEHTSPINYLAMGELFHYIASHDKLIAVEDEENYLSYLENCLFASKPFMESSIKRYKDKNPFTNYKEAVEYIQGAAHCATVFKSLSYLYFEAVSLSTMLFSGDIESGKLLAKGEYNNLIYIEINNIFHKKRLQKRFASYEFSPTVIELQKILSELQENGIVSFRFSELFIAIANNLLFYIGSSLKTPEDLKGMIFYDFCGGMQDEKGYQTATEDLVVKYMHAYWGKHSIYLVYNSVIEKGELGVTTAVPKENILISAGEYTNSLRDVVSTEKLHVFIKTRS